MPAGPRLPSARRSCCAVRNRSTFCWDVLRARARSAACIVEPMKRPINRRHRGVDLVHLAAGDGTILSSWDSSRRCGARVPGCGAVHRISAASVASNIAPLPASSRRAAAPAFCRDWLLIVTKKLRLDVGSVTCGVIHELAMAGAVEISGLVESGGAVVGSADAGERRQYRGLVRAVPQP